MTFSKPLQPWIVHIVTFLRTLCCVFMSTMLQFDGVFGDRTNPLMQDLVELDKQVLSRLYTNNNDNASDQLKSLRDKYVPIR